MQRQPSGPRLRLTPTEAFVVFVSWCFVGIVALIATLLLFPWSVPFFVAGALAAGYFTARFVRGRMESN